MQHRLIFRKNVPGSYKTAKGFELSWTGTKVMGILNITPDSFTDGGQFFELEAAIKHAYDMLEAGAFMLDIGGESSRPGAEPVPVHQELDRILPVIRLLAEGTQALLGIDTTKPEVAYEAIKAGVHLVNDIGGLKNPEMREVCLEAGIPAVIMHMQGEPRTMQENPQYDNVIAEVFGFLAAQAELALQEGMPSVMLDPGFGFGKTLEHNLRLVRALNQLVAIGHPVLLGASRKRSLQVLADIPEGGSRDPGSVAMHLYGAQQGAAMVRAHNVYAHVQALRVWQAVTAV